MPHLGQVKLAERPEADLTKDFPPTVPVQFPSEQKAQPHRSHFVFNGGPEYPLPHAGQLLMFFSVSDAQDEVINVGIRLSRFFNVKEGGGDCQNSFARLKDFR